MVKYQAVRRCLSRRGFAAVVGVAALLPLTPTLAQQQEPSTTPPVRSVAPVPVAAGQATPIPASADDASSARNDKADTTPVPTSSAEPATAPNGSRDDEVVRLRKELQDMRAQLRDYEQQLRAARAERGERTERGTRETRTAPAPENANPQENGKNYRTGTAVPAPPTSSNHAPPPAGEVRTVTRNGVTYRELVATTAAPAIQPGQIVVRSEDGQVQGLDRDTGKVVWVFRTGNKDANVAGVSVERGVASVFLSDGGILRLDLPTGKVVDRPVTVGVGRGPAGPNQEQRLKALEDKLDRLMKQVERLNRNRNEDRESKPGTSQGPGKS